MFLTVHYAFDWSMLWPLVLLIGFGALIPVILSIFKLKFIPDFVIEIIVGIVIAHISQVRDLFLTKAHEGFEFNPNLFGNICYRNGCLIVFERSRY